MLRVSYGMDDKGNVDYTCAADITAVFEYNGTKITFSPDTLGEAGQWTNLISAIDDNTKFNVWMDGENGHYDVCHENNVLRLSIGIAVSGGMIDVEMTMNDQIKETLIELKKLAHCLENGVAYKPSTIEWL